MITKEMKVLNIGEVVDFNGRKLIFPMRTIKRAINNLKVYYHGDMINTPLLLYVWGGRLNSHGTLVGKTSEFKIRKENGAYSLFATMELDNDATIRFPDCFADDAKLKFYAIGTTKPNKRKQAEVVTECDIKYFTLL